MQNANIDAYVASGGAILDRVFVPVDRRRGRSAGVEGDVDRHGRARRS